LQLDFAKVSAITIGQDYAASGHYGDFVANVRLYGVTELTSSDLAAS
jgi:hypothetical protein